MNVVGGVGPSAERNARLCYLITQTGHPNISLHSAYHETPTDYYTTTGQRQELATVAYHPLIV
jgi:hypothetical protein